MRLDEHVARVRLCTLPTPLEPAPRLAVALGLNEDDLWIKRDDLIGLGAGGNKVRKLEWTCGAALAAGADLLVTSGAAQSNHARLTAAAGARLGLQVVLVLSGSPTTGYTGNVSLDRLLGAHIEWVGDLDDDALAVRVDDIASALEAAGHRPAVIPFGGSSPASAQGYAECAREILAVRPDLGRIVVAVGSGGTMAGLVDGVGAGRVIGVDCGAVSDPARRVAEFAAGQWTPEELTIRTDQIGRGYSTLTPHVADALRLVARTEGIVLDPIYTGRAAAGLVAAVGDGSVLPGTPTVLLHTGGLPGYFGHPDAMMLDNPAPSLSTD
nr:pyridoxal-phosphate dependent enzyme [Rhodococcus sp. (in: high G+C Gram-positive bacteria)]